MKYCMQVKDAKVGMIIDSGYAKYLILKVNPLDPDINKILFFSFKDLCLYEPSWKKTHSVNWKIIFGD